MANLVGHHANEGLLVVRQVAVHQFHQQLRGGLFLYMTLHCGKKTNIRGNMLTKMKHNL